MDVLAMKGEQTTDGIVEKTELYSETLKRAVRIDFYLPPEKKVDAMSLLLVNDGQDLVKMDFSSIYRSLVSEEVIRPLLVCAIHSDDRKSEYGMAAGLNCLGQGTKAGAYQQFIVSELIPFIRSRFHDLAIDDISIAGFSLGGLSALDTAWNNPEVFSRVGVFSGALWWRSVDKTDKHYDPWMHRMMHVQVRKNAYAPELKFFFQCGEKDESEDLNNNGVIDTIDDTIDLMRELLRKGYKEGRDIYYLQLPDGKHNVNTWARAFPGFLKWGWASARRARA